jgi:uncharacterized protein YaiE (UPF0345 family)
MKLKQILILSIFAISILGLVSIANETTPPLFFDIQEVYADAYDSVEGNFTLDAVPTVADVDYVDASFVLTSTLTPDDTTIFGVNYTVTFSAGMDDLLNVTLYLYDDSIWGAAEAYKTGTPNGRNLTRIVWTEIDDTYTINQGAFTEWTEQSSIDPGSANPVTTYEFCTRFDMSRATEAANDFNVSVFVFDQDSTPDFDSASETGLVTVANYFDMVWSVSEFTWGNQNSNAVNVSHGAVSITFRSNTQWELFINSTDFNTSGESDVLLSNNILVLDRDGTPNGESMWVRNTLTVVDWIGSDGWDNQASMVTETPFTRNVFILLSTSNWFDAGAGKDWLTYPLINIGANT